MNKIREFFTSAVNLGTGDHNSKHEDKKVRYLNYFTIIWQFVVIIGTISNYLTGVINLPEQTVLFSGFFLCGIAQYLQYNRYYHAARVLTILMAVGHDYLFANYVLPGTLMEYFHLFPLMLMMVLYENKKVYFAFMAFSLALFFFPNFFYGHYPPSLFNNTSNFEFFIIVFLGFFFFKTQNIRNERLLQKQRNEALKQKELIELQKKELEELNRFQSKFFVNISHELRTPLTLIDGYATRIESDPATGRLIKTQTGKMKQIVNDILDVSKVKFNKLELIRYETDLNEILNRLYISFLPGFEDKGINFSFLSDFKKCIIYSDPVYLERALNNVLHNSLKFTEEGGKVNLSLSEQEYGVSIEIADTGIGIKESDLKHVLDHYFQGENELNQSSGSGIGLSFTHEIIKLHGGQLKIESTEGMGTMVSISMESILTEKGHLEELSDLWMDHQEKSIKEIDPKLHTILIVDDHPEMRNYLSSILENKNVIEAENGIEALEKIRDSKIDYIITDYMMPKMDGYEFVKTLKDQGTDTPILMLTARADLESKMNILRLGVDDFLNKPFHQEELILTMNRAINNYLQRKNFNEEESSSETQKATDPFIENLTRFIEEKCVDPDFGLNTICEEFALSTSSLYRKIRSLTGLSSNEFVREARLQKARYLIEKGEMCTLKEISYAVGFSKPNYFSGLYEKRFGNKPFGEEIVAN